MTQSTDANSWLMAGASVPSCTFPQIGTRQGGALVEPAPFTQQQRDLATSQPKFWDNGDPMMQLVVTVATTERDPANPEDDGTRRLYIKGQMQKAVAEGIRRGGGKGLNVGDELYVTFISQEEPKSRGFSGAKVYAAEYMKGNPSAQFLGGGPGGGFAKAPQGAPQAAPQPGAYQPTPAWQQDGQQGYAPTPQYQQQPNVQAQQAPQGQQYAAPVPSTYQQAQAAPVPGPDTYTQQLDQAIGQQGQQAPQGQGFQLPAGLSPEQLAALQAAGITGLPA